MWTMCYWLHCYSRRILLSSYLHHCQLPLVSNCCRHLLSMRVGICPSNHRWSNYLHPDLLLNSLLRHMLLNFGLFSLPDWFHLDWWSLCQLMHSFKLPPLQWIYLQSLQRKLRSFKWILRSSLCQHHQLRGLHFFNSLRLMCRWI
jgi:hypothetical protein